ncbi:hypothetical protein BD780_000384 [Clostridium tetanomorphum]|uniref:YjgB family protein n=1 Tax=Clostridium tetanomorphum TaxID=1553 RepID=UPI0004475215|nr:YjgB family protein [Clostridium tetanomorphum]KAJ53010.1 hypothetical protein CTM_05133 [Clostridium tetanomorphum DSM 665]MBP1864953.1 hypothetical protein [Clostridium tetanomorphum]NRS83159.1 hypothetical protein [Clostridium tetanomorphum]SQC01207.1 Uncharacterised protein [Clostridium tetanomorphum]
MISLFSRKSIIVTSIVLLLTFMVGCSSTSKISSDKANSNKVKNKVSNSSNVNSNLASNTSNNNIETKSSENNLSKIKQQNNLQKALLENIKKLAVQGKIINCEFPAKSTCIEEVEKMWGKADKSDFVEKAKGMYTTYSKHNIVFRSNKGSQIFEVRSFDRSLKQISLSMVKEVLGSPAYDVKCNGEEIMGYTAGKEFKILFVFPQSTKNNNNPLLHHYSVLYSNGTINNMADDPGIKW